MFNIIPPIKGGDKEQARIVAAVADSIGFSILGEYPTYKNGDTSNYYIQPIFARFDYSGNMLFQKELLTSLSVPMVMNRKLLIKKNDSIYYHRAYVNLNNYPHLDKAIFEINMRNGNVQKSKVIEFPGDTNANAVITGFCYNGMDKLFLGSYYYLNGKGYINVMEIDTQFNIIRTDNITNAKYDNAPIYLQLNSDSIFEIVGDAYSYKPNGVAIANIFYSELDINRKEQEYKYIKGPTTNNWGFYSADNLTCITKNEDKSWTLLLNEFINTPNNGWYLIPYFLKYSAKFDTLLWYRRFYDGPRLGTPLYTGYASVMCSDHSGYLGVSFILNDDLQHSAYCLIFKVSNSGDSLWMKKYVPLDFENKITWYAMLNPIIATPFNTYILVGDFGDEAASTVKPWILHIDNDGCLIPGCNQIAGNADIELNKNKTFLFYPNPTVSDRIIMLSRITSNEDYNLVISDLNGRELKKTIFKPESGTQYIINIPSEISSGEYLIKILGYKFQYIEKIVLQKE